MVHDKKYFLNLFFVVGLCTFSSCADIKKDVTVSTLATHQKKTSSVKLFIYPSCPYCKKVVNYLKSSGQINKVEIIDATKRTHLDELKRLNNNNTQCPFLYDPEKNVKMLESLDIIEYLKKRFVN